MDLALPAAALIVGVIGLLQLAWHIAVIVLVYLIWQKVKRLPG
jgi:hypothetical protein